MGVSTEAHSGFGVMTCILSLEKKLGPSTQLILSFKGEGCFVLKYKQMVFYNLFHITFSTTQVSGEIFCATTRIMKSFELIKVRR